MRTKSFLQRYGFVLVLLCHAGASAQIPLAFAGTPTLSAGTAGTVGAKYTYLNIGTSGAITINGVIEIIAMSGASLDNIDGPVAAGGLDNAFQPVISGSQSTGGCWSIQFRISFYNAATNLPVTLSSFRASGVDIDGNGGTLREYNTFIGPYSYTLDNPSNLTVTNPSGAYKFQSPATSFTGIALTQTSVAVTCLYNNKSTVDLIIGSCCVGGSCSAASGSGRQHSINFFDAVPYAAPTAVLPITLVQFSAIRESGTVQLNWITSDETNFSHFTVQRSADGRVFIDAAQVPAAESGHQYAFVDEVRQPGDLYYRLKMVDKDDKYVNSSVVRVAEEADQFTALLVYPNPVSNSCSVQVYSPKQQQVTLKIFDQIGHLIGTISKNVPRGTAILAVDGHLFAKKGLYYVQLTSGQGVLTRKVTKI